jgi:hypothetical protein
MHNTEIRTTKKPIGLLCALFLTAAITFAQAPPAGVQKTGVISLTRAESKTFPASDPAVESISDSGLAVFSSIDTSLVTLPMLTVVTIGPCNVTTFTLPIPITPPPPFKVLDAGPMINVSGPNGAKQIPPFAGLGFIGTLGGGAAPL